MSDVKISQLPSASSAANNAVLPIVASGTTSQLTIANLAGSLPQVTSSISASFATNANTATSATSASFALNTTSASFALNTTSASFALNARSASFAISASWAPGGSSGPISVSGTTLYSNDPSTGGGFSTINSIFLGNNAGKGASAAQQSNFLGLNAGSGSVNAYSSNFLGAYAGDSATNAASSNFFGAGAGGGATNANNSNFIGDNAGSYANEAAYSNFFGTNAGGGASSASYSNFIGNSAGSAATNANNSNFIGADAGLNATSASYSNFIGFKAGASTSPSSNNIVIGTNITLANSRKDSVNIGGIIFATGSYSTTIGNAFSGSMTEAKVGINKSLPEYTLDVSGSGNFTNGLNITGSSFTIGNIQVNSQTLGVLALGVTGSTTISDGSLRVRESSTDVAGGFLVNPASDFFSFAQQDASTELTIALSGSIAFGFGNAPSATRFLSTKGFQFTTNAGRNVEVSSSFKVSGSADFNAGLTITSGSLSVGNGFTVLTTVSQSLNFVDDAAAATGGVPLGGLYRSGSFVLIRLV